MPFYNELEDEDQDAAAQSEPGVSTSAQSSLISGTQGGKQATGGTSSAPPAQNLSADKPGNFVGLKTYLDANKPQAEKLGTQVGQVVQDTAQGARDSVFNLNQAADEKIKGVNALDSNILGTIGSGAEQLTQAQRDQAKQVANAQYTGPRDYTDLGDTYSEAAKKSQEANQAIADIGTEAGRGQLVTKINTAPRNQGMNVFDAALLQSGGGREKLSQIAQQNADVGEMLANTEANIQSKIGRADDPSTPDVNEATGAIGTTVQSQQQARDAIQAALKGWTEGFQPKVTLAQQKLIDQQNKLMQDLGGSDRYSLTPETMELLGLSEGQRLYGVDLNKFIQQANPTDINATNIATAEDYARYLALADLSGETPSILQAGSEQLAGTAPALTANKEGLVKEIETVKNQYRQQQLGPLAGNYQSDASRDQLLNAIRSSKDPELLNILNNAKFTPDVYPQANYKYKGRPLSLSEVVADLKIANAYRRQYDRTGNKDFLNMSQPSINAFEKLIQSGMFDNLIPGIKKA